MVSRISLTNHILSALQTIDSNLVVDVYGGEMSNSYVKKLPALYVVYNGIKNIRSSGGLAGRSVQTLLQGEFLIFVLGKNLRGMQNVIEDVQALSQMVIEKLNGLQYFDNAALVFDSEQLDTITAGGVCIYVQKYVYNDILAEVKK